MRKPLVIFTLAVVALSLLGLFLVNKHKGQEPREGFRGVRLLMPDGKIQTIGLEDYLVGVVAAEMPAEFNLEALKAQAVAARTYAVRRLAQGSSQDQGYDLDTTRLSQAWISDAEMKQKWGILRYLPYKLKIQRAVRETAGLVLVYQGTYVQAFFFSDSGRLPTEKASEVWSADLPYLTHVNPQEDEEYKFVEQLSFTPADIDRKLGTALGRKAQLTPSDIRILDRTTAGRVKTVKIGAKVIPATQLRAQLGLKSTDFTIKIEPKRVVLTTYGNGHAVGMSQYGANSLAAKGQGFREILAHYYPGTQLINIDKTD